MSRPPSNLLSLALLLGLTQAALADTSSYEREEIGPPKDTRSTSTADPESAFRLSPRRCYLCVSGWEGWGASRDELLAGFRGDVNAANEALSAFMALPATQKEVRLFPAPGSVHSEKSKTSHPCDWTVHWVKSSYPSRRETKARTESHSAVLTLFIARTGAIPPADPRAGRWVEDLGDDSYQVREAATQALARLSDSAVPALREALGKSPSPEQRWRIERLLGRLRPIHLSHVKIPRGVRFVSVDRLVAEQVRGWQSRDLGRSWEAISRLSEWASYSEDALPPLVEALQDQRPQVRDLALGAFTRLGKQAEGMLARLQEANSRGSGKEGSVGKAIQAVTRGADVPGVANHWRANRRLRSAITLYCLSIDKRTSTGRSEKTPGG